MDKVSCKKEELGTYMLNNQDFSDGSAREEFTCNAGDTGDTGSNPWVRKIPWRRKWQPTPSILAWEIS